MSSAFLQDLQAGITVTLVSVPTSVAYATLAGLPGTRGLTTAAFPLMVFGLLTKSKWLASGATSLTAVTVKGDLEDYGFEGGAYVELISLYSLLVGVASCALAVMGLGKAAKMIPKPVMSGFKWGAAMVILFSQTPDCLLGSSKAEFKALLSGRPLLGSMGSKALPALGGLKKTLDLLCLLASPGMWRGCTTAMSLATVWFLKGGSRRLMPRGAPQGSEVLVVCAVRSHCQRQSEAAAGRP